ncbi:MAG: hypothetical protein M1470_13005 [Bacteroidetes bacterium]|nr:hypothetical protein [Bacteroidota bacterium]MCL5739070.1 hypothetical protein [Bacteroidota bacterium]
MAEKKRFLLRINEDLYAALEKWAADDPRSMNAEVEYLLTDVMKKAGRWKEGRQDTDAARTKSDEPK